MNSDPTLEEMRAVLGSDGNDFDAEEAVYWYAVEHHGGQSSNLYGALSRTEYIPGPLRRGPSEAWLYNILVGAFGGTERTDD